MKRLLISLLVLTAGLFAQGGNTLMLQYAGVPSGSCAYMMLARNNATGELYNCSAAGTWAVVAGGGGMVYPVAGIPVSTGAAWSGTAAASTDLSDTASIAMNTNWKLVGAGTLAARPATCTTNKDVYICNGSGCTNRGEVHYCINRYPSQTYTNPSGTVKNYAVFGGTFTGATTDTYTVAIDSTGATDTFQWRKNSGSYTTGVAITGAAQTLTDGVTVTFSATTGNNSNDSWVASTQIWSSDSGNILTNKNFFLGDTSGAGAFLNSEFNTGIGVRSLTSLTTGHRNTAVGWNSMLNVASGYGNTCLGFECLPALNTGYYNTTVGYKAGYSLTDGYFNTVLGMDALAIATSAHENMAIGSYAMYLHETGQRNVAIGHETLYHGTAESYNIGIGSVALHNTTGDENVGIGYGAGLANVAGTNNVAIGTNSMSADTSGVGNVIIGDKANYDGSSGSYNVSIGQRAGSGSTGDQNIYLGWFSGWKQTTESNIFMVDNQARGDKGTGQANAILYGTMAALAANQTLIANAKLSTTVPGGTIPAWKAYTYLKAANGANGCANAKGCWQLNGLAGAGTTPAAAVTQALTVLALPANGAVEDVRIKTAVACTNAGGTATITDVGLTGTAGYYATGLTYNLETAAGDTNLLWPALAARGSNTAATTNVTVTLAADVGNIEDWADGCSFTVNLRWGVVQ